MTATPKRSWPLLLLAMSAFIPFLGFLFGSAAVTWGLLTDRPRAKLAIALGGIGALLQIAGAVALSLWLEASGQARGIQIAGAQADLVKIIHELDAYRARTGKYPSSLQVLVGYPIPHRLLNIYDQSAGVFRQRPYTYRPALNGATFDLLAVGPDGIAGTADDIRPSLADSLLATSGYRPSE